ncbi:MAG: sigma-70 family RNA polymerase sigma factor [Planctomycetes bacterium]|nr:sigma-70 family RNA polymerase sigma factor [Planctomycetota bacterium]
MSPRADTTDPDLPALQRGDPDAIDAFCRAEHPIVWRLCLGFLADAHEAEDAAQDALLRLLDRLPAYQPGRGWGAWRNTVVLNLCRDRARRRTSRADAEDRAQRLELPPRLPRPDELAETAELAALVRAALSHLPPREREAFVLRDLEGVPTDEAARVLGIGESSVRSLVTLARRRLRNLLAPRLPDLAGSPGGAT